MEVRQDEKTACRDVPGRAQRLGASQPEHRDEAGPIPCRDEQDTFEHRSRQEHQKPARSLRRLGAEMLAQQETGSWLAPRVALGLLVLTDAQAPDPAERQPERQARALELWALLERRQVEPMQQAQRKVARRANLGAAERWLVCLHRREKLQARQAEERCRAQMQLPGREPSPVLPALPARPEAPRAGQDALLRRQSWRLYQPLPLLPERRGQENVCERVRRDRGQASSSAFSSRLRRFRAGSRSGLSP